MNSSPIVQSGATYKRKKLFYLHYMMERIGHLVGECLYLRNVYPVEKYDIEIITYPLEDMPALNKSVFDIVTRGMKVNHSGDKELIRQLIEHTHGPVHEDEDSVYNLNFTDLYYPFTKQFQENGKHHFTFKLNEEELRRGEQLRNKLNIPLEAKILTLHVRESGYLPQLTYHSFRDADIFNYIPAIQYLINKGYYVVRIGDKTMKKLPIESKQFIDGPFCCAHCDFFDPYFISQSEFYIGMFSGPINVAQAFNIPTLVINGQIAAFSGVLAKGLLAPKQIYSKKLDRFLTYSEMLNSPIADFYYTDDYIKNDLCLVECCPEEIVAICKEMILRLQGGYCNRPDTSIYKNRISKIYEEANILRSANSKLKDSPHCLYLTNTEISTEFINRHPEFIGPIFAEIT